jgi:poly(3-hydroxybutyrate) depolymerase
MGLARGWCSRSAGLFFAVLSPRVLCRIKSILIVVAVTAAPAIAADAPALHGFNAAIEDSSISGISSGGFMAVQFATAWSSVIKGVGVVAGGPFWCARAEADDFLNGFTLPLLIAETRCTNGTPANLRSLVAKADEKAASGEIDSTDHLGRQKIYLFHGYNDSKVSRSVTDAAASFYRHYLGDAHHGNLFYQTALGAGHSLVVVDEPGFSRLNGCKDNDSPYIDQCGYDQAGVILQHIYGALNPPNRGQLTGQIMPFSQSIYSRPHIPGALSLGDTGYVFVPKDCEDGQRCRVHIALHGCNQDVGHIDRLFVERTGYNSWADTNRVIVLYPQTDSISLFPFFPFLPFNPDACWDWWSYVDHQDTYVTKSGSQINVIKAMLDKLTSAAIQSPDDPAAPGTAPVSLAVVDTSDTAAALVWAAVPGAAGYQVWRAPADGDFAIAGTVAGPSFGDAGLTPGSTYRWHVSAIVSGMEGPASTDIIAVTRLRPERCDAPGTCPVR